MGAGPAPRRPRPWGSGARRAAPGQGVGEALLIAVDYAATCANDKRLIILRKYFLSELIKKLGGLGPRAGSRPEAQSRLNVSSSSSAGRCLAAGAAIRPIRPPHRRPRA